MALLGETQPVQQGLEIIPGDIFGREMVSGWSASAAGVY